MFRLEERSVFHGLGEVKLMRVAHRAMCAPGGSLDWASVKVPEASDVAQ